MSKYLFERICEVDDINEMVFDKVFSFRLRLERDLKKFLEGRGAILSNNYLLLNRSFFTEGCSFCGSCLSRDDFHDVHGDFLTPSVSLGCVGFFGFRVDFLDCGKTFFVEVLDEDVDRRIFRDYGDRFLLFCSEECRKIALSIGGF